MSDPITDICHTLDAHELRLDTQRNRLDEHVARLKGMEQRLSAIERAATCGTGPNEPPHYSPPFKAGDVVEAINNDCQYISNGERLEVSRITGEGHLKFDDKPNLNYPAWCFRLVTPATSPVAEGPSGEPTPGMVAAAKNIGMYCDRQGPEYKKVSEIVSVETMATVINSHLSPELAELRAECERLKADNVRLKDDYQVAVNNIDYRSEELNEARAEIGRLNEVAWNARLERRKLQEAIAHPDKLFASQVECAAAEPLREARQQVATLTRERDGWIESARQFSCNEDFYRNIVHEVGEMFGVEAKTSDDGSVQDSVLALKVPELVRELRSQLATHREAAEAMEWLAKNPYCSLYYGFQYGSHKGWYVSGFNGVFRTPTAAILAAKAAANTGEK